MKRNSLANYFHANLITQVLLGIVLIWMIHVSVAGEQSSKTHSESEVCSTRGATNAITLSVVSGRISGVAPLAVFFDATGSTATATARPFHDLEYRWDFGDRTGAVLNLSPPLIGTSTWNSGSRSGISLRNTATGPVAAHVFETPGTYTVALSITDGTHTVSNNCTRIEVLDPELAFANSNTICVAATIKPLQGKDGCPAGAKTVQQTDFPAVIGSYAKTGKRILFKRGDTFRAESSAKITSTGPGTIGSYGSGALPLIKMSGNTDTLVLSTRSTPKFSDWRIMDLEFDGLGSAISHGIGLGGGVVQITTLRLTLRNFEAAIGFGGDLVNWWNNTPGGSGGHTIDQLAIVDSLVVFGPNTSYGGYNAGNRVAFMGNNIDNGGVQIRRDAQGNVILNSVGNPANGSHVTRFPYLSKAVISNNSLSRPGFDRHLIKLHAPTWVNGVPDAQQKSNYSVEFEGDGYSKQILISDNKFTDHLNGWSVAIGPQDSATDERVKDVILERNLHIATTASQAGQIIRAHEVTSRNNLYMGGGSQAQSLIRINVDGGEPPASNVWIYNNTQYSIDPVPDSQLVMVDISDARVSSITIKNNLIYAPKAKNPRLYANAGAKSVVVSNNSNNAQIKNGSNLFKASPPILITDWIPLAGSYAVDAGTAVPVWSDFLGNVRPKNDVSDIGAFELP